MLRYVFKHVLQVKDKDSFHSSILINIRLSNYQLPHPKITAIQTNADKVIQNLGYKTDIEPTIAGIFKWICWLLTQPIPSKQCIIELMEINIIYLQVNCVEKSQRRDEILYALGYPIIRIKNNDWLAKSSADVEKSNSKTNGHR